MKSKTGSVADGKWPDELISAEREFAQTLFEASEALSGINLRHLNEELQLTHTDALFVKMLTHEVSALLSFCCTGKGDEPASLEGTNANLPTTARIAIAQGGCRETWARC